MKRRDFIVSTVAAAGVVSVSAYYFFGNVEYDPAIVQPKALSLIWNDQHILAVGKQYRTQTPDESTERSLVKLLDQSALSLDKRISNDFETGRTVIVDGWILSETEARQCALASAIQSN